jgi:putative intracellular protease/amidase
MAKIAVLLIQGFADWEYALIAGTGGAYYGAEIEFFTEQAGEIHSKGGLPAHISKDFSDIAQWKPEVVAVIGGSLWKSKDAPQISELLNDLYHQGITIAGICGGTLALARAGLLNEVAHTSNRPDFLPQYAQDYTGNKHYIDTPAAVSQSRIITASGMAPVSFTAAVFEAAGIDKSSNSGQCWQRNTTLSPTHRKGR